MTKTQLSLSNIIIFNLFHDFGEMSSAASEKLRDGLIERSGNSSFGENSKRLMINNNKALTLNPFLDRQYRVRTFVSWSSL
jgi:hypothetical protein